MVVSAAPKVGLIHVEPKVGWSRQTPRRLRAPLIDGGLAMKDLEASTFQKRPCYRYLRESDHIPGFDGGDGIARVKLFDPTGAGTWYISEYYPETRRAFGRVNGLMGCLGGEIGYIDMAELVAYRGRFGLPIERDLHWAPRPLNECS